MPLVSGPTTSARSYSALSIADRKPPSSISATSDRSVIGSSAVTRTVSSALAAGTVVAVVAVVAVVSGVAAGPGDAPGSVVATVVGTVVCVGSVVAVGSGIVPTSSYSRRTTPPGATLNVWAVRASSIASSCAPARPVSACEVTPRTAIAIAATSAPAVRCISPAS